MSAQIYVRDIARITLPRHSIDGGLCMLSAYFDDSGTHDGSDIIVYACFIGTENEWGVLEPAWKAKRDEPLPGKPPLRKFHMTDCISGYGEFRNYSVEERELVIEGFHDIILASNVIGRAIGLSRHDWDRQITGGQRLFFGDAESFCVRTCLSFAADWTANNQGDKQVTMIFDDGPQHQARTRAIGEEIKRTHNGSEGRAEMFGPSFLPTEKFVPLQAADMLAWESYAYGRGWLKDPKKEIGLRYRRLIETNRITAGFLDREIIEIFARAMVNG
jgi:hypothetical protein